MNVHAIVYAGLALSYLAGCFGLDKLLVNIALTALYTTLFGCACTEARAGHQKPDDEIHCASYERYNESGDENGRRNTARRE